MINNINLKDYAGYLYATIDNQTKPLNLKEIEKDEVTIVNLASTGIPLYTSIPICVRISEKNRRHLCHSIWTSSLIRLFCCHISFCS